VIGAPSSHGPGEALTSCRHACVVGGRTGLPAARHPGIGSALCFGEPCCASSSCGRRAQQDVPWHGVVHSGALPATTDPVGWGYPELRMEQLLAAFAADGRSTRSGSSWLLFRVPPRRSGFLGLCGGFGHWAVRPWPPLSCGLARSGRRGVPRESRFLWMLGLRVVRLTGSPPRFVLVSERKGVRCTRLVTRTKESTA